MHIASFPGLPPTVYTLYTSKAKKKIFLKCFTLGKDDCPEALEKRLTAYSNQTEPVLGHYELQNIIHNIDAVGSLKIIWQRIQTIFQSTPTSRLGSKL